jgi:tight adherence protein B
VVTALLCCALATLCWPDTRQATRLRGIVARTRRRHRPTLPRPSAVSVVSASAAAGWLVAGVAGTVAGGLIAMTAWRRWQSRRRLRRSLAAVDGLTEAVRALVAGLRAGHHPAEAAESAAADARPAAAAAMRAVAASARLDGDLGQALGTTAGPELTTVLTRVSRAWSLAQRHGLPLADVLDAVSRDLDQRGRFTRQVLARLAGPKSSATVLSLLPVLGIGLGEVMGARPLHLLTSTPAGGLLLMIGVVLLCAGVTWSAHLTERVVPT